MNHLAKSKLESKQICFESLSRFPVLKTTECLTLSKFRGRLGCWCIKKGLLKVIQDGLSALGIAYSQTPDFTSVLPPTLLLLPFLFLLLLLLLPFLLLISSLSIHPPAAFSIWLFLGL